MVFEASSRVDSAVQRCPARLQRFRDLVPVGSTDGATHDITDPE
jgi:hypothetical protein